LRQIAQAPAAPPIVPIAPMHLRCAAPVALIAPVAEDAGQSPATGFRV
jgi:hypothetical protein